VIESCIVSALTKHHTLTVLHALGFTPGSQTPPIVPFDMIQPRPFSELLIAPRFPVYLLESQYFPFELWRSYNASKPLISRRRVLAIFGCGIPSGRSFSHAVTHACHWSAKQILSFANMHALSRGSAPATVGDVLSFYFLWVEPKKKSKEQNNSIDRVCLFWWYMSCQFLTSTSNCYVWYMCCINISFRESNCQWFDVTCAFSVVHLTSFKGKMFLCMCLLS